METLYLTNDLRKDLKKPVGELILGKEKDVRDKFIHALKTKAYKKLITVGDITSKLFDADIKIFDGRILRNIYVDTPKPTMTAENPPAAIDKDIWSVLEKALRSSRKEKIHINGEEDLLVLPLLILAEPDTIIVYGLPHKGICYVVPDEKTKALANSMLKRMRTEKFRKIAVGGTFDHFHDGHKYLLDMSGYYAKKTLIAVTSDAMAKDKPRSAKIQPYGLRKSVVEQYAKKIGLDYVITEISDIYGPAAEDKELDSIILTDETIENGRLINRKRRENSLKELEHIILPYILGSDRKKIASIQSRK